jgi:hypothetical protein
MRLLVKILYYFQVVPSSLLHAGRGQDRADGAGRPALLADDLAQVGLVDAELQNSGLFAIDLSHRDLIGIVNQGFAHSFN